MTPRYRLAVMLAAATGMRQAELRGLTWDRLHGQVITVDRQLTDAVAGEPIWGPVKSMSSERRIDTGVTGKAVLTQLRDQWEPNEWGLLWLSPWQWPVSRQMFSQAWRDATEDLDVPGNGWHVLRHYHASLLIAAGASPVMVAARLGHTSVTETLETYSHLWETDEAKAVAAVDAELSHLNG